MNTVKLPASRTAAGKLFTTGPATEKAVAKFLSCTVSPNVFLYRPLTANVSKP